MSERLLLVLTVCVLSSCGSKDDYDPAHDYFSFANTSEFVTRHIDLDLDVDFTARTLAGSVQIYMRGVGNPGKEIVLDTRDISVKGVGFVIGTDTIVPARYQLGDEDPIKGTPLTIAVPDSLDRQSEFVVSVTYETSPDASALQWLPAELTAGGKHPMMFSQSQAIHARSWIPLQDTPSARVTYNAVIRTPAELLAVMSANNDPQATRNGQYSFAMPQPIPSYLIAIAVGNLYFAPIGEDTGVYTEPELLDRAVYEFANTQEMLDVAEEMFGPYQWGRYDLLVLPPSFPYGGMENPRLSFITPSLLAGDRSLVSVIAHELAHSWSGNLVTNATWRDGWLNEGVTSYLESRLMEVIYDKDRVDEERVLGYEELQLNFDRVPLDQQPLAPRFDEGDPDDFQGTIHYHKGQLFLQTLDDAFGREAFDRFLLAYFDDHAFQTITTEAFLDYLDANLLRKFPGTVSRSEIDKWMYEPGLPSTIKPPVSNTLQRAAALAAAVSSGEASVDEIPVGEWSPQASIHFLNSLPDDLDNDRLAALDSALNLSNTSNAEIGRTWFIQVAKRRYRPAYDNLEAHLNRYGRTRLIAPVYGSLVDNGEDAALAAAMFEKARHAYHPVTVTYIERLLKQSNEHE